MRFEAAAMQLLLAGSFLLPGCQTLDDRKLQPEEKILGVGQQERSGATARPQGGQGGRQGTLVMIRADGKAAFRLTTAGGHGPISAAVTRYVVTGFDQSRCQGNTVCSTNGVLAKPVPFGQPTRNQSGTSFFEPAGHDNGVLAGLLGQCGCTTAKVKSVEIEVQVGVNPQPNPPSDLVFVFCQECQLAES